MTNQAIITDNRDLVDLIKRCRDHADFLDDTGLDGDGEDVRDLIRHLEMQDALISSLRTSLQLIQSRFVELHDDGTARVESE